MGCVLRLGLIARLVGLIHGFGGVGFELIVVVVCGYLVGGLLCLLFWGLLYRRWVCLNFVWWVCI